MILQDNQEIRKIPAPKPKRSYHPNNAPNDYSNKISKRGSYLPSNAPLDDVYGSTQKTKMNQDGRFSNDAPIGNQYFKKSKVHPVNSSQGGGLNSKNQTGNKDDEDKSRRDKNNEKKPPGKCKKCRDCFCSCCGCIAMVLCQDPSPPCHRGLKKKKKKDKDKDKKKVVINDSR